MKKTNKGFTLVELLAVIVILAIIMIIAIPAVLQTMQSARQKTFKEYVTKVYTAAQNSYLSDTTLSGSGGGKAIKTIYVKDSANNQRGCTGYDVATGLGLSSVGTYTGAVLVCPGTDTTEKINILVRLQDGNYNTKGWINYTDKGEDFDLGNGGEDNYGIVAQTATDSATTPLTISSAWAN